MTESTGSSPQKSSRLRRWLKGLLLVIILLIILIGVNLLYASVADTEFILDGEAGDLLYLSAFDGFLDEWDLFEGQQNAQIVDDTLQIGVTVPNQATWSNASYTFQDFDITLDATAIEGPIDNAFGVIFRLQSADESACDLPMIVLCGVADVMPIVETGFRLLVDTPSSTDTKNYYAFLISSDGYYSVWKVENGVEEKLSAWIASPIVNLELGADNTIRVVGRGSQFQFFINGEQVNVCIPDNPDAVSTYAGGECIEGSMQSILVDDSIPSGKLGALVQATQTGGGGVVVQFDNMMVLSPSQNIEKSESNA